MIKKLNILLFFLTVATFAQNANRKYISHQWIQNTLEITTSDGKYRIEPYSDKIIETSFIPNGQTFNPESHAVVLKPNSGMTEIIESSDFIEISTKSIKVQIRFAPFQISYFNKNQFIVSEKNGYTKKDSTETIDFNLNTTEALYGGAHVLWA